MRNTATHRAPGASITPLGRLPKARSVVGGVMLAGVLSTGAAATATAAPTWPTCDGDGISDNCPPLGETAAPSAEPTWPSCDGDGIPNNCPPLGEVAAPAPSAEPSWPSCDGDGIPNNCPPLGEAAGSSNSEPEVNAIPAGSTAVTASVSTSSSSSIVDAARQAVGTDYSWGGESLSGMDCSGLVTWAYGQSGIDLNGNRTADQIMTGGQSISVSAAQPGDLVGYKTGGSYGHVAVYLGDGKIVDASGSRDVVIERSMWSGPNWEAVSYR